MKEEKKNWEIEFDELVGKHYWGGDRVFADKQQIKPIKDFIREKITEALIEGIKDNIKVKVPILGKIVEDPKLGNKVLFDK